VPEQALPQPTPLVLSEPLEQGVQLAAGYGAPWRLARGAWISSDGKSVAYFARESASSEGFSRTLVVKDVDTDAVISEQVLFSEEEQLQLSGADLERLARSRAREARSLLAQRQWRPLLHQELPAPEFSSDLCFEKRLRPKRTVSLGELSVTYQEPQVRISRRGRQVFDRRFPSWRVRKETCEQASPSWLKGVFFSREQGVVVLELGFCGVDGCNEPPAAFHVLRLPGEKAGAGGAGAAQAEAAAPAVPFIGYETQGEAGRTLYARGLPAISEEGELVAVAEVLADGERHEPNLLLSIRRARTQETVWSLPVLEAGELWAARGSLPRLQELDRKVRERIHQANAALGGRRWVTLVEQPVQPVVTGSCQEAPEQKLVLEGLEVTFHHGRLTLKGSGVGSPLDLELARGPAAGEKACEAASRTFLDAAYVDLPRGVLLLRLSTCSDEECPSPDAWYHALGLR
jgi:hypothetical protein